jgi:hypothetical protein
MEKNEVEGEIINAVTPHCYSERIRGKNPKNHLSAK